MNSPLKVGEGIDFLPSHAREPSWALPTMFWFIAMDVWYAAP